MKKSLAGGALLASSLVLSIHFSQNHTGDADRKQVQVFDASSFENMKLPAETNAASGAQMPVTLAKTIDGDTIKVMFNGKAETIRYLLIDTPESKKPGMCVQPFAEEASIRNNQLVQNCRLTIEFEPGNQRDNYGRLLAYVFADGQSVQETLLKEGFARVAYIINPEYKYLSIFQKDERTAKMNRLHIWSLSNYVTNRGFKGCEKF